MNDEQRNLEIRVIRVFAWACAALAFFAFGLNVGVRRFSFPPVGFEMAMAVAGMSSIAAMIFGLASTVLVTKTVFLEKRRQILLPLVGLLAFVIFVFEFVAFFLA